MDGYSEKKKKTPQLTLTPNSATKRRIQCLSKWSLSSLPTPITLYVPVKFREIKSTSTADSSAPAACGTVPSVVPVCVEICTESRRGDRRREEGRKGSEGSGAHGTANRTQWVRRRGGGAETGVNLRYTDKTKKSGKKRSKKKSDFRVKRVEM